MRCCDGRRMGKAFTGDWRSAVGLASSSQIRGNPEPFLAKNGARPLCFRLLASADCFFIWLLVLLLK